jgi:hypothetical protein
VVWRSYQAKRTKLVSHIAEFKQKLALVPELETERQKLEEEVRTNRELYNSFLRARTAAQISEAAQNTELGETIEVLQEPMRPLAPVRPNKVNIVLLAVIFGASLGLGAILVSEYTDTSFRTVEDIESKLELRVLGTVPVIVSDAEWTKTNNRRRVAIWLTTSVLVVVLSLAGFYYYGKKTDKGAIQIYVSESLRK